MRQHEMRLRQGWQVFLSEGLRLRQSEGVGPAREASVAFQSIPKSRQPEESRRSDEG